MKLHTLIEKIISKYAVSVCGRYDGQTEICQADVLAGQDRFDGHTLYVGACLPEPMDTQSAQILLTVSPPPQSRVCFIDGNDRCPDAEQIVDFVRGCLSEDYLLQDQKSEVYQALYNGYGLQGILAAAENFLVNPMYVIDLSYRLVAPPRSCVDISPGLEDGGDVTFLNGPALDSMKRNKLVEAIFKAQRSFIVTTEYSGYSWLFCPVYIHGTPVGYISCCNRERPFRDSDRALVDVVAQAVSLEMQKDEFYTQRTGIKYEFFLIDLLEGHIHSLDVIQRRLQQLDRTVYANLWMLVLKPGRDHYRTVDVNLQMKFLRELIPNGMALYYNDSIVMLVTQKTAEIFPSSISERIDGFVRMNDLCAGISLRFTNILDTHEYYLQALAAIETGEEAASEKRIFWFSELIVFYLLRQKKTPIRLDTLIHPLLRQLEEYDRQYHTDFMTTLRSYFSHARNSVLAANALHIHRSTFFYRMNKIKELLNISLEDSETLFAFELSFKIMDYSGHLHATEACIAGGSPQVEGMAHRAV